MKYSIDLQDIINKNYLDLWNRYKPLQMVYYKKMPPVIKHDIYEYGFTEFRQDCYIILVNAVSSVKPEKIKDKEHYSFYMQYSQYLHNFTKRNIVRDYCNNWAVHYMDYEGQNDEDEHSWDSFLGMEDRHSNLALLLQQLNDKDRDIAKKIMFRLNRGTAKLSDEAINLIKNWYSEY
jgi:hypothetical protein